MPRTVRRHLGAVRRITDVRVHVGIWSVSAALGSVGSISISVGGRRERGALVTDGSVEVRVGQLWRRRRDGRPFIPARRVDGGWLDRAGIKRTSDELRDRYVLVQATEAGSQRGFARPTE
jgi:hypothetical protein